jgi:hypothetical protein
MEDLANPGNSQSENRRAPRRRVLKRARIVFQQGHCSMGCQILNLSDTGALLIPSDLILCPKEFVLKPDVGQQRDCEVVWRKGTQVAVRYV